MRGGARVRGVVCGRAAVVGCRVLLRGVTGGGAGHAVGEWRREVPLPSNQPCMKRKILFRPEEIQNNNLSPSRSS